MSVLPISSKQQILNGDAADLLAHVCQFVDSTETSKVSKVFRNANLLAVARIFREKSNNIRLNPKLAEEREPAFQLIQTKIDSLSQRGFQMILNHRVSLDSILEKYRNSPDHFFAIHSCRHLEYLLDIFTTADDSNPLRKERHLIGLLIRTEARIYHNEQIRRQGAGRPPLRDYLQENQWIERINQSIQRRLIPISATRPLDVNSVLNALYADLKQRTSVLPVSHEIFQRALHTDIPGSITNSLLRLAKIEEIATQAHEVVTGIQDWEAFARVYGNMQELAGINDAALAQDQILNDIQNLDNELISSLRHAEQGFLFNSLLMRIVLFPTELLAKLIEFLWQNVIRPLVVMIHNGLDRLGEESAPAAPQNG